MYRITSIRLICSLLLVFTATALTQAESKEIFFSNLDKMVDSELIGEENPDLWRALSYETDDFNGVMLAGGGGKDPKPITIRLGVKGVYQIYAGI